MSLSAESSDEEPWAARIPAAVQNPAQCLEIKEVQTEVRESLLELDPRCAKLIDAHVLQERTLEDCAQAEGVGISTIHDWKQKCLGRLRKLVNLRLKDL